MAKQGNGKLVLSRSEGESIALTGGIEFTVEQILGNRVKIGIRAPRDVIVLRTELIVGAAMTAVDQTPTQPDKVPA